MESLRELSRDWLLYKQTRDAVELLELDEKARRIAESRDYLHQKMEYLLEITVRIYNLHIADQRARTEEQTERKEERSKKLTAVGKLGIFVAVTGCQILVSLLVHALTKS